MKNLLRFSEFLLLVSRLGLILFGMLWSLCLVAQSKPDTTSYIQTLDIKTGKIDTVLAIKDHFEAPNWHPDNYLVLNSKGKIYTLNLASKKVSELNTGSVTQCNNDHGISPDKKWLVVSHNDKSDPSTKRYKSALYIIPIGGGQPRRITPEVPSFWHGWTPDSKTLAYCAERNGNYDIYTIGVEGGTEKRLTSTEGLDDGPDYSPDGKYIYFNRSGGPVLPHGPHANLADAGRRFKT